MLLGTYPKFAALFLASATVSSALGATVLSSGPPPAGAAPTAASIGQREKNLDRLTKLGEQVMALENNLVESLKANSAAKTNLRKIQMLITLQKQERVLGQKRMSELEDTVRELELRRESLNEKISLQRKTVHRFLMTVEASTRESTEKFGDAEVFSNSPGDVKSEDLEQPRRRLLANLASRGLKALEEFKADLSDADQLQARIQEEKEQLANLFQDLNERDSVLELNRQLQADLVKKTAETRISQLENYRKLKSSQAQVEQMIGDFNARRELERTEESERYAASELNRSGFGRLKGHLEMPVSGGQVLTAFGRAFDPKSRLYIFKKGVDIKAGGAGKSQPVKAIFGGKIAYSGELPEYGRVAIIDHGSHFYSLCAHLGELKKKPGENVAAGDDIGTTDDTGVVYFEIRSRNVALNPLQWISGSFSLAGSSTQ